AITRTDIVSLLDRIVDRGAPIHANRTLAVIRKLFNWAVARGSVGSTPAAGIEAPGDETQRDRVWSEKELRAIWRAASATPYPCGPFFQLLVLTGQRRDEVAGMSWGEIDESRALWTIPRSRAKNDRIHEVPLSPAALDILRSIPRIDNSGLVFTTTGRTAI